MKKGNKWPNVFSTKEIMFYNNTLTLSQFHFNSVSNGKEIDNFHQ